jgi:oligopeptide/dipeptide ABC transporter ATP-binding protein
MYAGKVVEQGAVSDVLTRPSHPYTEGLLRSVAALGSTHAKGKDDRAGRLPAIPGGVPDLTHLPPGCRFAPRCSYLQTICNELEPTLAEVDDGGAPPRHLRRSRCHFADKVGAS